MGKFHKFIGNCLGLFCASAFAFQALASEVPRGTVSTTVNPTTGYRVINESTIRTPPNVNVSAIRDVTPQVSRYPNGLQQTMPAGVTIQGVKESNSLGARVRATTQTLKGGAKSLLRGGVAGLALTAGLEKLLDDIGALIEDGQVVQKKPVILDPDNLPSGYTRTDSILQRTGTTPTGCDNPSVGGCITVETDVYPFPNQSHYRFCRALYNGRVFIGYSSPYCYYLSGAQLDDGFVISPMSPSAIDDAVDNYYEPDPDDWKLLSPRIQPDDVEIYQLPSVMVGEPVTNTSYDAQGNPITTRVTTPSYEFESRDSPSPEPKLDLKQTDETKTYNESGHLVSTETTVTTDVASHAPPNVEIPTDCDFMPTVCRFLDWFREPDPELGQDPDFSQLIDTVDIERHFSVGSSTSSCPAPFVISLTWVPSVEVSLQPFCDLADLLRPFLLSLCFLYSGMIILRT